MNDPFTCPVCGDLDANCQFCDKDRASRIAARNRKAEAVEWVRRNLVQTIRGEEQVCLPNDPEEILLMIASIIAYARTPKSGESEEPSPCQRFERIEVR